MRTSTKSVNLPSEPKSKLHRCTPREKSDVRQESTCHTVTSTTFCTTKTHMPDSVPHTISSPGREGVISGLSNLKRRLEEIEAEINAFKTEEEAIDDEVSTLTKSFTKMSEEMLEIRCDLTSLGSSIKQQMKELRELIIASSGSSEKSDPSPNRSKRYKN
jgi:septal ring factor EnvC (AmiA/AmiB activator)